MSRNKRENELVEKVNNEIINNINVSEESKAIVKDLLKAYESATFKEWTDRAEWYADLVEDMVNECGFNDDKIAEKMANNNPTLQQSFYRMVMKFIKRMAEKTYWDGRNEASVRMCKKLNEVIEGEGCYVPFV